MSVEVIFVGTGDAFHSGNRAHQAIWIRTPDVQFLVDCGSTTLYRMKALNLLPQDLEAIFFTHFHADHMSGAVYIDLNLAITTNKTKKLLYAGPQGLEDRIRKFNQLCYPSFYREDKYSPLVEEYEAEKSYSACSDKIKIKTFSVTHAPESLAYLIEVGGKRIAISGDTQWDDNLIPLAKESDLFICECFHYKKFDPPIGHLSYEELLEKKDHFSHTRMLLVHAGPELIEKKDSLDLEVAEDGMSVNL